MGLRGRSGLLKPGPWDALVTKEVALDPALKSARGMGFPSGSVVKHLPAMQQTQIRPVSCMDVT